MAYKIINEEKKHGTAPRRIEVVLDSENDLADVGTVDRNGRKYLPGSIAMVADTSRKMFMINASGEWAEV